MDIGQWKKKNAKNKKQIEINSLAYIWIKANDGGNDRLELIKLATVTRANARSMFAWPPHIQSTSSHEQRTQWNLQSKWKIN